MKKNIVESISFGRTSSTLGLHLKKKHGDNVTFVFMDTGAEDPETYEYAKRVNKEFDLNVVCLRAVVNPEANIGVSFEIVDLNDCKHDMKPFKAMMAKYGTPYIKGAFCTDRLKNVPFKKYCDERFGKHNYEVWLGIRADEPKRFWGDAAKPAYSIFRELLALGYDEYGMIDLWNDIREPVLAFDKLDLTLAFTDVTIHKTRKIVLGIKRELVQREIDSRIEDAKLRNEMYKKIMAVTEKNIRYLGEVKDWDEEDILGWWRNKPYDLTIPAHRGNCLFCIKKSMPKIALAARDQPELLNQFREALNSDDVNNMSEQRGSDHLIMYREKNTLETIIAKFKDIDRDDLFDRLRSTKQLDEGACSESCELDL